VNANLNEDASNPRAPRSFGAVALVAAYLLLIVTAAAWIRPLEAPHLAGVALAPAAVALLFGLAKLLMIRAKGLIAPLVVFHVFIYPALAVLLTGIPAAWLTVRLAALFGP